MTGKSALQYAEAGIMDFADTLKLGIIRSFQDINFLSQRSRELEATHYREDMRLAIAIKEVALHRDEFYGMVKYLIENEYGKLNNDQKYAMANSTAGVAIKLTVTRETKSSVISFLAESIASDAAVAVGLTTLPGLVSTIAVNAFFYEGVLQKASDASARLKAKDPVAWHELSKRGLDMLYFLVEKPISDTMTKVRERRK